MAQKNNPGPSNSKDSVKRDLTLRFEFNSKQHTVSCLTLDSAVEDLELVICSMLRLNDPKKIRMKTLQPTKIIDCSDGTKKLSEIFSQARERIVVELVNGSSTINSNDIDINNSSTLANQYNSTVSPSSSSSTSTSDQHFQRPLDNIGNKTKTPAQGLNKHHKTEPASNNQDTPQSWQDDSSNALPNSSDDDSPSSRQRKVARPQSDLPVCSSTGYLLRHPVPSNNSCLFTSVHFCLTGGEVDENIGKSMRKIIANTVASDRIYFDDAFLGQPNANYCLWILDNNNWGGAIELSILCKYYHVEIVAIDVKNTRLNRFGEDSHFPSRMLLLYDGLHYDPLKFQPLDDVTPVQTLFPSDNEEILTMAEELAREAKQSHQFTDVKAMTMKCSICQQQVNSLTAPVHANETGHANFVELE